MKSKHKIALAGFPVIVIGAHLGNEIAHHLLAERPLYAALFATTISSVTLMVVEKKKASLRLAIWREGAAERKLRCRALRSRSEALSR